MDSIEEILQVTQVLAAVPLPAGPRVAVIGNSGGPGILAADAAIAGGLTVPLLSDEASAALACPPGGSLLVQSDRSRGGGAARGSASGDPDPDRQS